MKRQQQQGFTLIELIIVIVILGILAVTAAPRFLDLGSDAREASMRGILGALNSTSQISHAAFLVNPNTTAIEGVELGFINGYPSAEDMCELIGLYADDNTANSLTGAAVNANITCAVAGGNALTIQDTNATTAANCQIVYTEATAGNAPAVATDFSDC